MRNHSTIFILLAVTVIGVLSGCEKDKTPVPYDVNLKVNLTYGTQPFEISTINTDPIGMRVRIEKVKFYLSRIKLVKTDGTVVDGPDAALLDASIPGSLEIKFNAPAGSYKEIRFGTGLDAAQNAADPTLIPEADPLNEPDMYWTWLKYIFLKVEGRSDTTTTGSGSLDWLLVYHLGTDAANKTVILNKTFEINEDKMLNINLSMDIRKLFYGATNTIDIRSRSFTHSESSTIDVTLDMATNFSESFSVQ